MKDDFCSYCGSRFETTGWPRHCVSCDQITYQNPDPVAVILQPIVQHGRLGALVGKRAIEPQLGKLALISGYVSPGETAEEAAKREFLEETSFDISNRPLEYVYSRHTGTILLLFFKSTIALPYEVFEAEMKPCGENSKLDVMWFIRDAEEMAFPLHREFFTNWKKTVSG